MPHEKSEEVTPETLEVSEQREPPGDLRLHLPQGWSWHLDWDGRWAARSQRCAVYPGEEPPTGSVAVKVMPPDDLQSADGLGGAFVHPSRDRVVVAVPATVVLAVIRANDLEHLARMKEEVDRSG